MTSGSRRRNSRSIQQASAATDAVVQCLTECPAKSVPARLVRDVAAESRQAAGRDYSDGEIIQMTAQSLVQARLFWNNADPTLRAAASHRDLFPDQSSTLGRLLRLAICEETRDGRQNETRSVSEGRPSLTRRVTSGSVSAERPSRTLRVTSTESEQIVAILNSISPPSATSSHNHGIGELAATGYDSWLGTHQPRWRSKFGIFFTPRSIARPIVGQVDAALRNDFGLPDGLADTTNWHEMIDRNPALTLPAHATPQTTFVQILDPAAGDGVFLEEVIASIHQTLQCQWESERLPLEARRAAWNEYVSKWLVPRLNGMELLLPQLALAWLRLTETLARTGYDFDSRPQFNLWLSDTLAGPDKAFRSLSLRRSGSRQTSDDQAIPRKSGDFRYGNKAFTVLVGNPPFAALSQATSNWMAALLKATQVDGRKLGSYYELDGKPLRERKLWLHDDYVKFLRFAQWQIERSGGGIVGFVTNHSYLDNVTFRGMRQSLLNSFAHISLVDLHGSRKKWESSPNGDRDENVFGIDQGVAIGIFSKPPRVTAPRVEYAELWGDRDSKLVALAGSDKSLLATQRLDPQTPNYFFVPQTSSSDRQQEYEHGYSIDAIMPVHGSAAVTARDSFVVSFTAEELAARLDTFRDATIDDEVIRQRFFQNTRSRRYVRGDTRGWKMPTARAIAQELGDLAKLFHPVQYRPFDHRVVVWADWLIDWPRTHVMRYMLEFENVALVTRRQMLASQPCNFFFVTDTAVIDGLLRSDNRGNETFFPLYVNESPSLSGERAQTRHNFSIDFIDRCRNQWTLEWIPRGAGDLVSTFGPGDLLGLIYAQFFAAGYRERYAHGLRLAFPRVFVPRDVRLVQSLCKYGNGLIRLHLLRDAAQDMDAPKVCWKHNRMAGNGLANGGVHIAGKYPLHDARHSRIELSAECYVDGVSASVWQYQIGTHQVCRKWIRDRRGMTLTDAELTRFCCIVCSIDRTIQCANEIDRDIESAGGWPSAFVGHG